MEIQSIKNRFGIIGNSPALNYALQVAGQVALTDLSVLIMGESGVGKEVFSQIIHALSARKHNPFIAVNCGAIPEGTIDSELFGHEKGSFTGAVDFRKGYFETVNGGTIFLDEIGELPLGTQARLLRVLETGEYIRVGSSKVHKKDITLLFRKFAVDFAEKYKTAPVQLDEEAKSLLINYPWPGNVRELKNIADQVSVLSQDKQIGSKELGKFLQPYSANRLPVLAHANGGSAESFANEREILYKLFFDMKKDVTELKKMFFEVLQNPNAIQNPALINELKELKGHEVMQPVYVQPTVQPSQPVIMNGDIHEHTEVEESLNIMDKEKELIIKALKKHRGKRKDAALDLGISERTLYRKLKEYNIEE